VNAAEAIGQARRDADLTQAELAERSGTSQATISAYEHGARVPTAATLVRVLAAAGRRLITVPAATAVSVPSASELERRSRVLAQVVELAERLPSVPSPELSYPRLPRSRSASA
jgi:transcriptional regulator with XRE-family HTH domain